MSNFLFMIIVGAYLIVTIQCNKNNICPTFRDYYNKENNPRCWYDPDLFSNATAILKRHKYNYEVHSTITPDGYILNVYRLPPKRNKSKGLVFLSHCATCSMVMWIDKGNQSMAFLLVEEGYDVWLGNFRGSPYSQKHVTLSRTRQPKEYFNFTFHEMGIYDLPMQFELIRNVSGSSDKIYYIGHSLGTTTAYVYASLLPKHAKEYIHLFILWSPSVFLNLDKSILNLLVPFRDILLKTVNLFNLENIVAYNGFTFFLYYMCFENPRLSQTCPIIVDMALGFNPEYASPPLFPSILIHNGGHGFPGKGSVHYAQVYKFDRFQWFDYGKNNEYYYNSRIPPEYPIENIAIPMYFFCGKNDSISATEQNLRVYNMLRPELRYGFTEVNYNHVNTIYGKNAYENIWMPTVDIIKNFRISNQT